MNVKTMSKIRRRKGAEKRKNKECASGAATTQTINYNEFNNCIDYSVLYEPNFIQEHINTLFEE